MMGLCGILSTFLILGTIIEAKYFRYEDCGKVNGGLIELSQFDIKPDPINLRKNMSVTLHMILKKDVPAGALLKTRYHKIKRVFGVDIDVPIPCLLGKFGSCTMKFCKYLALFKDQAQPLFPAGVRYGCPVEAGIFNNDEAEIEIPDMGTISRMIVGGRYRTKIELIVNGTMTDCYKFWTEMK